MYSQSIYLNKYYLSQFLLQKLDTNILPLEYDIVVRATDLGPEGKEIFIIKK